MAVSINVDRALAACKSLSGDGAKDLYRVLDDKLKALDVKPGRGDRSRAEATEGNVNVRSLMRYVESVEKPADDADDATKAQFETDCGILKSMHATLGMRL